MKSLLPWLLLLCILPLSAAPLPVPQPLSFTHDVQPILTRKCVACHTCYDAPCQLNLGSGEGVQRGASQQPVYDGSRRKAQATTRLFVDAGNEAGWRSMGFSSVLDGGQRALLLRMLELGRAHPLQPSAPLPSGLDISIRRDNQCPLPRDFDEFARKNPASGMPFAVSGLSDSEFSTLQRWVDEGARLDIPPPQISASEAHQIQEWEAQLNASGPREQLVARWLYEHLFLAHLYFDDGRTGQFFELVRSRTPPGQPVSVIATRRPNDDPGTSVYYRIRPLRGVIVHKTHITYPLSSKRLQRVRELFFGDDWSTDALPGYGAQRRANPFETFAAIPARARYQFMLDSGEYFVRTFIRGPVCRGQIATDVIRDQFWTLFQDPEHDLYITDARYREQVTPLLSLPGQQDELASLPLLWAGYRARHNDYEALRRNHYAAAPRPSWSHIWAGNDSALLTIFRHHDSASVHRGLLGAVPQTLWWMDYPLLERTYYALVVNFDVFGNVSHQAQTRLYFDLIRNGAEQNFLRLMPAGQRKAMLSDWYQASGRLRLWLDYEAGDDRTPTALQLPDSENAKVVFASSLLQRYGSLNARPDPLNRCQDGRCFRPLAREALRQADQQLSRLASRPLSQLPVIAFLPEVTMIRVGLDGGGREIYSLLRNRAHSNVAFMLGESLRYRPERDTLTLYPEVLSSYPNFMFSVHQSELASFVTAMQQAHEDANFQRIVARWGIRRSDTLFWQHFHDLEEHIREHDPVEAGALDMNRYEDP